MVVWYGGRSRCVVWYQYGRYYGGGIVWYGMVPYHHCGTKFAFFRWVLVAVLFRTSNRRSQRMVVANSNVIIVALAMQIWYGTIWYHTTTYHHTIVNLYQPRQTFQTLHNNAYARGSCSLICARLNGYHLLYSSFLRLGQPKNAVDNSAKYSMAF